MSREMLYREYNYVELRVTEQDVADFLGVRSRRHEGLDVGFEVVGKPTTEASEPVLGIVRFDNKTIYMVEHGDTGIMQWRIPLIKANWGVKKCILDAPLLCRIPFAHL